MFPTHVGMNRLSGHGIIINLPVLPLCGDGLREKPSNIIFYVSGVKQSDRILIMPVFSRRQLNQRPDILSAERSG